LYDIGFTLDAGKEINNDVLLPTNALFVVFKITKNLRADAELNACSSGMVSHIFTLYPYKMQALHDATALV